MTSSSTARRKGRKRRGRSRAPVVPADGEVERDVELLKDRAQTVTRSGEKKSAPLQGEAASFPRCRALQLISSSRDGSPGTVSGARWMHGGTGLPGQSTAMRQRFPKPNEKGRACGTGA